MFTKCRMNTDGYLALLRRCQSWGFALGVVIALVLTYFVPWMPQPEAQLTMWLVLDAVVGALCAVAGAYWADVLTDDSELIPPPAPGEASD